MVMYKALHSREGIDDMSWEKEEEEDTLALRIAEIHQKGQRKTYYSS